jgi:hypothetical protein
MTSSLSAFRYTTVPATKYMFRRYGAAIALASLSTNFHTVTNAQVFVTNTLTIIFTGTNCGTESRAITTYSTTSGEAAITAESGTTNC